MKADVIVNQVIRASDGEQRLCLLNSNTGKMPYMTTGGKYDLLAGWGCLDEMPAGGLATLDAFLKSNRGKWMFGFLSYDLKNEIESLRSMHEDLIGMPLVHFFVPATVLTVRGNQIQLLDQSTGKYAPWQESGESTPPVTADVTPVKLEKKISRNHYIETVNRLQHHIRYGDIYEINYCQEYFATGVSIDPAYTYQQLNDLSPAPMSAYYRLDDRYVMSSSPERFIRKEGDRLFSQPIKGTAPRGAGEPQDRRIAHDLLHSEKERAENVMIVDLVRNDLSRVARRNSVHVDELFGIYPFSTVHQMISTVSCRVEQDTTLPDVIRAAFPMGSMTGAPKVRAMQLIDQFESSRRGLFSGALGYVSPDGDYDFSVMIRTLLYRAGQALSLMTGSAITAGSNPESEYDECLLKAEATARALGGRIS